MNHQLTSHSLVSRNSQLIRDLTLSNDAPLAYCIRLLLQKMDCLADQSKIFDFLGNDPSNIDIVDARNIMFKLGYSSSQEKLKNWNQLNSLNLPALYLSPDEIPYIIYSDEENRFIAANINEQKNLAFIEEGGVILFFRLYEERKKKTFLCLKCSHKDDSDVNAAKNIRAAGLEILASSSKKMTSPMTSSG